MIKKILGFILVVGLGFVGFSSATTQQVGLASNPSFYDDSYEITALVGGRFITNYLGIGKGLLALSNSRLFFWSTNGFPYWYASESYQGFFDKYSLCSYSLTNNGALSTSNCIYSNLDNDSIGYVRNFLNSVSNSDYFYYSSTDSIYRFCWSSSTYGKALCFGTNNRGDSLGYSGLTFSNISASIYQNGPFGSSGGGGSSIPVGDLTNVSCPTVGQLILNYNQNGFYSGLCYSSSKIFNGSSFVSVEPQSIFDLFSSKDDFISSLNKFSTYCESSVYNSNVCVEAFSGEDLRFNLLGKIPQVTALGGRKSLYTYCGLYNYDPNATTCVSSGVMPTYGQDFSYDDVVHSISNGQYTVYSPVTNNSDYDTVFNNGSGYEYSGDIITNIQQLFGKFTSLFKQQIGNTPGILPLWILIPFIIIVLFKLFKK